MKHEDDLLFGAGSKANEGQDQGTKFGRNAPPAKELAAAVANLDLESALGIGVQAVPQTKAPRRAGAPPVEFDTAQLMQPAPTVPPTIEDKPRVVRGPVAVEPERIAAMEKPSLLARIFRVLFGWMRKG
ncbi:MAG: hypothetical protein U1F36_15290 [Planctomycetota bacterium]